MTSLRLEIEWRKRWLAEWPGHITCVEPTIGSTDGAPDVMLACRSSLCHFDPGWVEFKWIEDGSVKLEASQRFWMRQFLRHSNRVAVVSMDRDGFYIHPAKEFLLGSLKPSYAVASLPSPLPKQWWDRAHTLDLPKLVEMVYVSAQ
jgi:hypothetical protein